MKNTQKGFVVPLIIAVIVILAIGGGLYYQSHKKSVGSVVISNVPAPTDNSSYTYPTPTRYQATGASASWPLYTNDQYGFHVKYPDKNWSIASSPNRVSFTKDGSGSFIVNAQIEPIDAMIATTKNSITGSCVVDSGLVAINEFQAKKMTCQVRYFDANSSGDQRTFLFIEKGGVSYEISFSLGTGRNKNDTTLESSYIEMVSTFGFNTIKAAPLSSYSDPKYKYSFKYPSTWITHTGGNQLSLESREGADGIGDRLDIVVIGNSTFEATRQFQGSQISNCTPQKVYFINKILGTKCDFLAKETYFFEKNGNLYYLSLVRIVSPRSVFDGILNSFNL